LVQAETKGVFGKNRGRNSTQPNEVENSITMKASRLFV